MHKTIKRFGMDGVIDDDSDFQRLRDQYESLIVQNMRGLGYVPVLDLGTYWSTTLREDGHYDFQLSAYGVKIGRNRSWEVEGISLGREIQRTPLHKSKPSFKKQE